MTQWPNLSHDLSIGLANDWQMHENTFKSFQSILALTQNINIPRPFAYVYQTDRRWMGEFGLAANMPPAQSEPRDLLISQRIPPVPLAVRETLINTYCPERGKGRSGTGLEDRVCLIHLYLGKRQPIRTRHLQDQTQGPSNFFSLSNFKIYFDQMIDLELHVSFIAETMANALAMMHWKAKIDGRDIEFVLGGVPGDDKVFLSASDEESQDNLMSMSQQGQWSHTSSDSSVIDFKGERVCMWLLDFNQCHKMTMDESGVKQAVDAYFMSGPYYPRPPKSLRKPLNGALPSAESPAELLHLYEDDESWSTFRDRYLATSAELLKESAGYQHLPREFIGRVMEEHMERFTKRSVSSSEPGVDKSEPPEQGEEEWVVVPGKDLPEKAEEAANASK
jgi:Zinc finger protein